MNIDDVRRNIDTTDKQLIKLLAVRTAYVNQIIDIKKQQGAGAEQPDHFKAMIEERLGLAKELSVPLSLVHELFEVIHNHSVKTQDEQLG